MANLRTEHKPPSRRAPPLGPGQRTAVQESEKAIERRQRLAEGSAASRHDLFQATLNSLGLHVAAISEDGTILMTNRAWDEFASANDGDAPRCGVGANYLSVCGAALDDAIAATVARELRAILSGGQEDFELEYPCHSPDRERWFLMRAVRHEGHGARAVVTHADVTERRRARAEESLKAALLDEIDAAVVSTDIEGKIVSWSDGAEHLYGWRQEEALGRPFRELLFPHPGETTEPPAIPMTRGAGWAGEILARHRNGSSFSAHVRVRVICDADDRPSGLVGVSSDISDRVASERALRAAHESARAVADGMAESLYTIDNEGRVTYANRAAEELLGWSNEELRGQLAHNLVHSRHADGSPYPIEECPITRAGVLGGPMRVDEDVFIRRDGQPLPVAYTASPFQTEAGVQGCAVVFRDITEQKAREASMRRDAETLALVSRIQDALDEGRFVLHSQPIIDLRSGEVVQQELLLRMTERDGEIVAPAVFLPIAERYGLIDDIDRWVIAAAVKIAAEGDPVQVNLSARSLGDPSILQQIESSIAATGADPELLVFEITETAIADDETAARAFAQRLHQLGCKLALDDFGTGYGAFTYLKQLPVDYLKIDIEFIRDLVESAASRHLVNAVIALARNFGLQTIAEGVEDSATLKLLSTLGVDFAQGYHIARPGPIQRVP